MKRLILVITLILSVTLLVGCGSKVEILEDTLNVIYENPRYENGNFYIDTYITNGFDEDLYVGSMDFGIYPIGNDTEVAGAGFDINETIEAGKHIEIELEFTGSYVFVTEEALGNMGYSVDDLELYFWLD